MTIKAEFRLVVHHDGHIDIRPLIESGVIVTWDADTSVAEEIVNNLEDLGAIE